MKKHLILVMLLCSCGQPPPNTAITVVPSPVRRTILVQTWKWQWISVGKWKITAYDADCNECGTGWKCADRSFADYKRNIVAADKSVTFGTKVYIEGQGQFTVKDRGGKVRGRHLDMLVRTHRNGTKFGVNMRNVWVWKPVLVTREIETTLDIVSQPSRRSSSDRL
jgi:3D (Asp-Asp-Asp) domain-containing protein